MKKKFNDTGTCISKKHYMVDTTCQLEQTIALIEEGEYFIINRPRQFGKTTTLSLLEKSSLLKDYIILRMSFEGIGDMCFQSEGAFIKMFVAKIKNELEYLGIEEEENIFIFDKESSFADLAKIVTKFIKSMDKPVVLLIDEVDQASNNNLFVRFLGLLRNKYLLMNEDRDFSFYSVVLAGLHDVKNLKLKLRPDEEAIYNSPWNIAISYDVDMTFSAKQIETMLVEYVSVTNAKMDIAYIANKLYYHTSGYPYFVSKLCKIVDEKIKPEKWEEIDIIEAIKILLEEEENPNFDKLIKILEENKDLTKLVKKVSLGLESFSYNSKTPLINFGKMHGFFRSNEKNRIAIFNKIYDKVISEYFESKQEIEENLDIVNSEYLTDDGKLDLKVLLTKFKDAVKEKYSSAKGLKSKEFLEDDLRMMFFMYLKPILNGIGFSCKEAQTCEERRIDVVIFFRGEKFIVELKIWRGEKQHKAGLKQLKEYMDYENVQNGYMLIMNKNKTKEFKTTTEDDVFIAWV